MEDHPGVKEYPYELMGDDMLAAMHYANTQPVNLKEWSEAPVPTKEPIKVLVKDEVKEPPRELSKESTVEPVKEPINEPIKEPIKEAIKELAKEPKKGKKIPESLKAHSHMIPKVLFVCKKCKSNLSADNWMKRDGVFTASICGCCFHINKDMESILC